MKKILVISILVVSSVTVEETQAGGLSNWLMAPVAVVVARYIVSSLIADAAIEFVMSSTAEAAAHNASVQGKTYLPMLRCNDHKIYPNANGCPAGTTEINRFNLSINPM